MKKILLILLGNIVSFNIFAAVATSDVYVMAKDSERASTVASYYLQVAQDIKKNANDFTKQGTTLDKFNQLINSKGTISKICTGCSDVTIEQLQDWQNKNAKNICEELNNQLDLVNGHITNISDMNKVLDLLKTGMGNATDPQAYAKLGNAISSATNATLTEMNQTQQQLAAYNLQKEQKNNVDAKMTEMKLNKSMFGQANICDSDSSSSSCN